MIPTWRIVYLASGQDVVDSSHLQSGSGLKRATPVNQEHDEAIQAKKAKSEDETLLYIKVSFT